MNLKRIMSYTAAFAFLALVSCGVTENPINVANDAVRSAEHKFPAKESTMLGKLPSYQTQESAARYYVDSVFSAKARQVNQKYDNKEASKSTVKKYAKEREALNVASKEALDKVQSIFRTKIQEENEVLFANNNAIDIPVNTSSLNMAWYKKIDCYLSRSDKGYEITLDITATPEGCTDGYTISGKMNFLVRDFYRLIALDAEGKEIPGFHPTVNVRGSNDYFFTVTISLTDNNIKAFANLASIQIMVA